MMSTPSFSRIVAALTLAFTLLASPHASAQKDDTPDDRFVLFPETAAYRLHTMNLGGKTINYVSTAGTITLFNDGSNDATANVFYVSYRKYDSLGDAASIKTLAEAMLSEDEQAELDRLGSAFGQKSANRARIEKLLEAGAAAEDVLVLPDAAERPISFSFNGGPGSSSVWLHLGVFGPQRIEYGDAMGHPGPPPYKLVDNESSLLGETDWVFIDPVSTGFSRTQGDTPGSKFHGVEQDIASVGEFIRRFLTTEERWASPKFIAGESYGTTRAAGLADYLHERHGITLNGVVLISTVLDFATIQFNVGHDLPYVLFLPSFAATAHHYGKLSPELQALSLDAFLDQAEDFAGGEYASALFKGTSLSDAEFNAVADRMAELTGLSPEYVRHAKLRVSQSRFSKELLRDEGGQTVGRFDSRYIGIDRDDAGERYSYDPSYAAVRGIFTQTFNDYLRRKLGYKSDLSYEILTGRVHPWDYGNAGNNRSVNTADRLRDVMQQQPHMKLFVASGRFDLATPYYATEYVINHMMLRENVQPNVSLFDYGAGHMMYLNKPDREKLSRDLKAWYAEALGD